MPPPIPRPSRCTLTSLTSSSPSTLAIRTFTTTSQARHRAPVPPESPKYISVPEPPQSTLARLPPIRGHLPVPREIFPPKTGTRKLAPDYVARATPLSRSEAAGEAARTDLEAWRRRMAHSRRAALATGLKGLYERKARADKVAARRTREKAAAHEKAATAPERPDEVFTRSTILASVAEQIAVRRSPTRFADAERSARRSARKARKEAELRRDALGELYIAAKDFIVDEAELARKVDELFDERYFFSKGGLTDALSVWDIHGVPIKTAAMVDQQGFGRDNPVTLGVERYQSEATKAVLKQKIIAEELTGGKL